MLVVNRQISIPRSELEFTFSRSGGPGGQNVNKVNTKATLHWDVAVSQALPEAVQQRFLKRYANRLNKEGQLVLSSQRYRDQARNVDDCLQRLQALVLAVVEPPKRRKATRPTKGSQERRLKSKKLTAEKKQSRRETF